MYNFTTDDRNDSKCKKCWIPQRSKEVKEDEEDLEHMVKMKGTTQEDEV